MIPIRSKRVLVFGDSIAWGAGDDEQGGWVERLKLWFQQTGKFHEIFNLGCPGEATRRILGRVDAESKARLRPENIKRDVIILQLGLNDSQITLEENKNRTDIVVFRQNVQDCIDISHRYSTNVIIVGPQYIDEEKTVPLLWNKEKAYRNSEISRYNEELRGICEKEKLLFIDLFATLGDGFKDTLADGVHPGPAGHEMIYQLVHDKAKGMLLPKESQTP